MQIQISGHNEGQAAFNFTLTVSGLSPSAVQALCFNLAAQVFDAEQEATEATRVKLYSVHLIHTGNKKIDVIREIRSFTGLGLVEAKDLSEQTPTVVVEAIERAKADAISKALIRHGASVELVLTS